MTIESTGTVPAPEIDRRRVAELTAQQRQLLTERTPNSGAYFERARKVMPKGVPSSFQENDPWPVYIERGHGAQVWDVDGNEYIDFHNGFGVMCIGHANPQVAEAVKRRVDLGTHFAAPTEGSIQVAEELRSRFRLPQWRFTNSGTESTMDAIHVARGATGRDMILKIEGSYHGHHDAVMVSVYPELEELGDRDDPVSVPYGAGYPRAITELTRSVPFNDARALAKVLERLDGQVAALIMEPAMMNINIVPPVDGYLDDVRRITSEHGVVLIFDEVKTGATISPGGATQRFGVTPDIVTLAKASCGGLPGGSIGMTEELAAVIADGTVHQYGTFNGNPLVMAAAHATLTEVLTTPAYMQFETTNDILRRGCDELIEKYGLPCYTDGLGAKGCVVFASEPLREYRDYLTKVDDDLSTLAWLYHMNHGIFMTPGVEEEWTLSVAHTHEHVQRYLDAFEAFAKDLTGERDVAMANRLADETSPYLLQHKDNPVDWYPWGEEALARAKAEDKPLLVSIGYSACHWCHVMEHESFEDPDTAAVLNEHFVPVKVDREERPDVDTIYMGAVQAMTGHGGWPLNVFVDPDGVPFYGGTYFPPEQRQGMPSFRQVLEGVSEAWQTRREEIKAAAPQTIEGLSATSRLRPAEEEPASQELEEAEHGLAAQFDPNFGGFGGAPKFPPASALEFLMARIADGAAADTGRATEIVRTTLERMARGGIYDQVGGGFARYSVDAHWLVPHFEKMLYDNALLARAYLHAWQLTGDERFRRVCEETLDWALREMRGPEGGFYSALDADSEGEEGKFYVWSEQELRDILGDDADAVLRYWGVDRGPNFEGRSILYEEGGDIDPEVLARSRKRLYDVRARRVWPGLDDKRLTAWNALMLAALADAGAVLGRGDYLEAARQCAEFLTGQMRDADGRLLRTYKDGRASLNAYLEDHAFLSEALLVLYEATLETRWFVEARALADDVVLRFRDPEGGGFFDTASDHESLVVRPRSFEDHPIPAGSSSAAYALLRIFAVTGDRAYERPAVEVFRLLHQAAVRHPQAFGHLLQAMHFHFSSPREVALVGERFDELAAAVHRRFHPTVALAGMRPGDDAAIEAIPLLRGREPVDGRPAAYVCENFTCRMPVTDPEELDRLLA